MSDTVTGTLTDFLLARIDEDEQRVRKFGVISSSPMMPAVFARLLAECEAKRRIIALHEMTERDGCDECGPDTGLSPTAQLCPTLRLLAMPYADHPDFRDAWRPRG